MNRRRSKKISRKKFLSHKKRRKSYGSKKGKSDENTKIMSIITKSGINKDYLFKLFSSFIKPIDVLKTFVYTKKLTENTLKQKPDESTKLTICQKIERYFIKFYRSRVNKFVEKLTPEQILKIVNNQYTDEVRNYILLGIQPSPVTKDDFNSMEDSIKLFLLKTIPGNTALKKIKKFLKELTDTQLVLLINGKYNVNNAAWNAFLSTDYPTKLELGDVQEDI